MSTANPIIDRDTILALDYAIYCAIYNVEDIESNVNFRYSLIKQTLYDPPRLVSEDISRIYSLRSKWIEAIYAIYLLEKLAGKEFEHPFWHVDSKYPEWDRLYAVKLYAEDKEREPITLKFPKTRSIEKLHNSADVTTFRGKNTQQKFKEE